MKNINKVIKFKNKCFGCGACCGICKKNAITMHEDEEGFFYPKINSELCDNCGLCEKICPSLNKSKTYESNSSNPDCFALMASDSIREKSSSGGAFTLFANYIIDNQGYVCGASFLPNGNVVHTIVNSKNDLDKLRGSKYIQSDTRNIFKEIKRLLSNNKIVLFVGTPCQVAALNNFLIKKYENLFTIDLLCHGVPPQKVFKKYLSETLQDGDLFYHTSFRDKIKGWGVYATTTTTTGKKYYGGNASNDPFLQAFIKNMCLRPSCGTCPFTSTQREGDITIGDFWKVERFDKRLNDNKGTSVVLLNNKKGHFLMEAVKNSAIVFTQVPISYASYFNITLKVPLKQHPNRKAFFRLLSQGKSLRDTTEYCKKYKYDCAIMNFWPYHNVGGLLEAWALQNILSKLNYSSALIYYNPFINKPTNEGFVYRFSQKHLIITDLYKTVSSLKDVNHLCNNVILGGDCIWGNWWSKANDFSTRRFMYMGSWVDLQKKLISYAPSFGNSYYSGTEQDKLLAKYYLSQIDYISVRESSGVDILKNEFSLDSTRVLDPTLMLSSDEYSNLLMDSKFEIRDYILVYTIGVKKDDIAYNKLIKKLEHKKLYFLDQTQLNSIDVADWLYLIKNCQLLITNSYHALCFALKFNKLFYIFAPYGLDFSRFDSLLNILSLEERMLKSDKDVENIKSLFSPINWNQINNILSIETEYSKQWLCYALESPKKVKHNGYDAIIKNLSDRINSFTDLNKVNNSNKQQSVSYKELYDVLFYHKNYRRYILFRVLKNFVFGNLYTKFKNKQKYYRNKIDRVKNFKFNKSK